MRFHRTRRGLALLGLVLACKAEAIGDADAPSVGLVQSVKESHSLQYSCQPREDGLTCEFVQASVRRKTTAKEAAKSLEGWRAEYRNKPVKPTKEDCDGYRLLEDVATGRKPPPKPEVWAGMAEAERMHLRQTARNLMSFCKAPSEDTFLQIHRDGLLKDQRTCNVSTHKFTNNFKRGAGGTWLVQSAPEGVCGAVHLSRFEPERIAIGGTTFTNWKFISRKAVTNPAAEWLPKVLCSEMDQAEYIYDWRSKASHLSCDWVEFSPI